MGAFVKATPEVPVWDKVLFRNLVTLVVGLGEAGQLLPAVCCLSAA